MSSNVKGVFSCVSNLIYKSIDINSITFFNTSIRSFSSRLKRSSINIKVLRPNTKVNIIILSSKGE